MATNYNPDWEWIAAKRIFNDTTERDAHFNDSKIDYIDTDIKCIVNNVLYNYTGTTTYDNTKWVVDNTPITDEIIASMENILINELQHLYAHRVYSLSFVNWKELPIDVAQPIIDSWEPEIMTPEIREDINTNL